jgi:peptide/nickel transport system substrate-binding protein
VTAPPAAPGSEARTLVALAGNEPASIAARSFSPAGTSIRFQQRVVNALPALIDAKGSPQPELLASLPALNTQSWQVFPDGTMQTTYALRPNLTWHNGEPLTSEDFVFSWRVYSSPDLGLANQPPMTFMSDLTAVDREHFTIKWKRTYPDADNLSYTQRELPPLPQHILGPAFDKIATGDREAFVTNPYWTREYVGLGPYRITNWESGALIELVRFEGYALGAPKIGRLEMRFGTDANVTVANMLASTVHFASSLDSTESLRQEWSRTNRGRFLDSINAVNFLAFQLRLEYANPTAPMDPRVRKAIAHMVDKQTLVDTVFGGNALPTDTPVWIGSQWGAAVDSSVPIYPFDLRAAETLMTQAGYRRGADGFYGGPEGRIAPLEVVSTATPDKIQTSDVVSDWLKAGGLDSSRRSIPNAQTSDNEVRSTYPGVLVISSSPGETALSTLLTSASISSAGNHWVGGNRTGWSNPEYDGLLNAFSTTLDRSERVMQVRQMLRVYSEELPFVSLFFSTGKDAVVSAVRGPGSTAPEANAAWNIHEWSFE